MLNMKFLKTGNKEKGEEDMLSGKARKTSVLQLFLFIMVHC